jgi:hypothetical protein
MALRKLDDQAYSIWDRAEWKKEQAEIRRLQEIEDTKSDRWKNFYNQIRLIFALYSYN